MHTLLRINENLKRKLEPLFANHHCVDFAIPVILEGQSGKHYTFSTTL